MPQPSEHSEVVKKAFAYCEQFARTHYENFPVASWLVPSRVRPALHSVYAFARTADDFADEGNDSPSTRLQKLDEWERKLHDCYEGNATDPVFIALAESVVEKDIPSMLLEDLLTAFRMDVTIQRYESFDEVLHYCRHSANPVGRLVLSIFGYTGGDNFERSDDICTALQLTNFWQDVSIDIKKPRIYLPLDDLERFGYTEQELKEGVYNVSFEELMEFQVDRTERLFHKGKRLIDAVGRDLRVELALTWVGGMTILKRIRRANYNVLRDRPHLTKWDALPLLARASLMVIR